MQPHTVINSPPYHFSQPSIWLQEAISKAGYTGKIEIGMDVAASEFYKQNNVYDLDFKTQNNDGSQKISGDQLRELYLGFCKEFPITSIEDPFDQVKNRYLF